MSILFRLERRNYHWPDVWDCVSVHDRAHCARDALVNMVDNKGVPDDTLRIREVPAPGVRLTRPSA